MEGGFKELLESIENLHISVQKGTFFLDSELLEKYKVAGKEDENKNISIFTVM